MRPFLPSVRYTLAVLVSTQRWAPPAIVLVGLIAWVWVTPPVSLDTLRITLLAVFALASWLGQATGNAEDAGQEMISTSCRGSATRLLLAKWFAATVLALAFPTVMLLGAYAWTARREVVDQIFTREQAIAGTLTILAVALTGAALGLLVSSVIPGRPGWAAVVLIVMGLTQAAPWMAPVPMLAASLPSREQPLPSSLWVAFALACLLGTAFLAVARAHRRPAG